MSDESVNSEFVISVDIVVVGTVCIEVIVAFDESVMMYSVLAELWSEETVEDPMLEVTTSTHGVEEAEFINVLDVSVVC